MTREEQEKLGKEIVEKLNKGKKVRGINISNFYNIKQFYYIKIEKINSDNFNLIILPIDNDGEWLLEVKFKVNNSFPSKINLSLIFGYYYDFNCRFQCFTKFKLTGNYLNIKSLDHWLVKDERFWWILEYLKEDNPEYNLAMYELFGINEEYIKY